MSKVKEVERDYKQFVFHFDYPMPSINVHTITKEELEWCRFVYKNGWYASNKNGSVMAEPSRITITKMFDLWMKEELV